MLAGPKTKWPPFPVNIVAPVTPCARFMLIVYYEYALQAQDSPIGAGTWQTDCGRMTEDTEDTLLIVV